MKTVQIKNDIYWVGVNDHETYLFEGMWPIDQDGVAYNAYIINDDKVAVVDTVKSFKQGEYIEKIKGGWTDIDVIITMPAIMGKIGALGRVLGPRGLMPNPKSGTVTNEIGKAVKEVKQGKIDFKVDKNGIVHASVGKVSFSAEQIRDNAREFISALIKLKPTAAKGTYVKSVYLSSTMSPGIKIDPKSIDEI